LGALRGRYPPNRPGRLRKALVGGLILNALLAALAAGLLVAPRFLEGHAALLWTRHHAARVAGPRAAEHARQAVRWGLKTLELTAPLPMAREGARLALGAARHMEASDSATAFSLYADLRAGLEQVSTSRVRGLGLGGLNAEARDGEERARAAATGEPQN
jgi:hypothetical protein